MTRHRAVLVLLIALLTTGIGSTVELLVGQRLIVDLRPRRGVPPRFSSTWAVKSYSTELLRLEGGEAARGEFSFVARSEGTGETGGILIVGALVCLARPNGGCASGSSVAGHAVGYRLTVHVSGRPVSVLRLTG